MPESKLFRLKKTELAQTLENLSANQTAIDEGKAKLNEEEAKLGPAEKEIAANEKTLKDSKKETGRQLEKAPGWSGRNRCKQG